MAEPKETRLLRARRLLRAYDVRPVDPLTGERPPAAEFKAEVGAPTCFRCGREHVKVFEVECDDGKPYTVGSGCVSQTFGGWEPGKAEITRARTEETKRRRAADEEARKAWVADAVRRTLAACPHVPTAPPVTFAAPDPRFAAVRGQELAQMGEAFAYVPPAPPPGHPESYDVERQRRDRLNVLHDSWRSLAAKACMQQAGPPPTPTGIALGSWDAPALHDAHGLANQVRVAVLKAWGVR